MLRKIAAKLKANTFTRFIGWPILILRNKYHEYKIRKTKFYNELFSNVKEGSLVIDINGFPGTYQFDIRSDILQRILLSKKYEPEIVTLIKKHLIPNKDAINIGANVGIFTILLADLIDQDCKVLAVEPTPLAFEYLNNNIKRNELNNKVILFNGICSDSTGEYSLNTIEGNEEYSSIGESMYMSNVSKKITKIKVAGETVNMLVNKFNLNPGLILIDVEGAEMKVITGASEVLEKYKPIIISELSDELLMKQGNSSAEIIEFLLKLGYHIKDVDNNQQVKFPFNGNIIAVPN